MNPGGFGGGGGYPPSGGGYPPGGGMPPAGGGGGWGPPPGGAPPGGGGGWGPPPGGAPPGGGGGWGQPPIGGAPGMGAYAPPAGGGGYGPPPGPMGAMGAMPGGQRVVFNGDGGKLFGTYLLYMAAPLFVGYIVVGILIAVGMAMDRALGADGIMMALMMGLGGLAFAAVALGAIAMFTNKFYGFYYESLVLDGQSCQYTGTVTELAKIMVINMILTNLTCGIYTPWAIVRMKEFVHSKVLVNGQPNRLSFHGDPASLLGTYIIGVILMSVTCYIYGPWFVNDLFAFMWENTKLDGRPYQFRKDPGGFFGTYLLAVILSSITCGIYYPWGFCNILKWEADRVA